MRPPVTMAAALLLSTAARTAAAVTPPASILRRPSTTTAPIARPRPVSASASPSDPAPSTPPFTWGVATASYQIEGAVNEDGRGPSIWDTFSHTPGKTARGATGDVACDFYHKWRDDVRMMADMGVSKFRFSLAWPRILPSGKGDVNEKGLQFYSDLVDALLAAGIEPWVTLYHWDLPQALQDEYGGWTSERIIPDFANYARIAFSALGDRVVAWSSLNEPWVFSFLGHQQGVHAPGLHNQGFTAARHAVLAHAAAAAEFKRIVPHGRLSVNINGDWAEPWSDSQSDVAAARRALDLGLDLFAEPLFHGQWPRTVLERVPHVVPFSPSESAALRAARPDFFALNFYTAAYVRSAPGAVDPATGAAGGFLKSQDTGPHGKPVGDKAQSTWLYRSPWAMRSVLRHVAARYPNIDIAVTENGCSAPGDVRGAPLAAILNDTWRVEYYKGYLQEAEKAVRDDNVPLTTYFAWSLLDNFEWADGYDALFGISHVDFDDPARPRTLKASGKFLSALFAPDAPLNRGKGGEEGGAAQAAPDAPSNLEKGGEGDDEGGSVAQAA